MKISRQYAYKKASDEYFTSLRRIGTEYPTFVVSEEEVAEKVGHREEVSR